MILSVKQVNFFLKTMNFEKFWQLGFWIWFLMEFKSELKNVLDKLIFQCFWYELKLQAECRFKIQQSSKFRNKFQVNKNLIKIFSMLQN